MKAAFDVFIIIRYIFDIYVMLRIFYTMVKNHQGWWVFILVCCKTLLESLYQLKGSIIEVFNALKKKQIKIMLFYAIKLMSCCKT